MVAGSSTGEGGYGERGGSAAQPYVPYVPTRKPKSCDRRRRSLYTLSESLAAVVCTMANEVTSDSKATEAMLALRYWVRATDYQLNTPEKEALIACEEKSYALWRAGIAGGGAAGLLVTAVLKAPLIQRVAVPAAFASAGSLYGQYRANLPCMNTVLALPSPSPLADAAKAIMRDGAASTVRALQQQNAPQLSTAASAEHARPRVPLFDDANASSRTADGGSMLNEAHTADMPGLERHQPWEQHQPAVEAERRPSPPQVPPTGDSWELVRQRYRARSVGDDAAVAAGSGAGVAAPAAAAAAAARVPAASDATRPRHARKNLYGDEVFE